MVRKGQLVQHISSKHLAIVLMVFPTKKRATIIYLQTLKVCIISTKDIEPYDPNGDSGGGHACPLPVFTDEEINELAGLIHINGGALDSGEIRYTRHEQQVVFKKLMHLRDSLSPQKVLAYV